MPQTRLVRRTLFGFAIAAMAPVIAFAQARPAVTVTQTATGLHATVGAESVDLTVCTDAVIHVVATPNGVPDTSSRPWMLAPSQSCPGAKFEYAINGRAATLTTALISAQLSLRGGGIAFRQLDGKPLLQETNSVPRTYDPERIGGATYYHVTDRFSPTPTEAIYGLGQHQNGLFNYRGATVELAQNNTDVAIPLLLSTNGYGLLWNTASLTYVDNRFPQLLAFRSLACRSIDYYFIYGPEFDSILHHYRTMTGHTPLLPKWAYGYFQSKDRYTSLDQIAGIAQRYRTDQIPLDVMVQDWFWWKHEGDPVFNANYHDVPGDLAKLHQMNVHAMISVWGLMDPASANYKTMVAHHWDIPGTHVYDPTNPAASDFFWNNLVDPLFKQGWDAFWLDSAEPEEYYPHIGDAILQDKTLEIGPGAEYTNIFPLMHTLGVQNHWKAASQSKRVFLLTRSAFLGQQRVGATVWSGDVYSTWWALQHQVRAGLNFMLSGYPYWTTDIGGYWPPYQGHIQEADYQQLYARWLEYGVFCPIFRSHGHRPENEFWSYPEVEPILVKYDKLRYRLMPYIYSLAWKVTSDDYTIMRPLVMDFPSDSNTWNVGDQYMFGPALMVAPVIEQGATSRQVYLPPSPDWYNFWTGATVPGSRQVDAVAPLDRIPLYVRAGSIVPMGPEIQYANQSPGGPIELRIYPGANGSFTLYNDSGDGYAYQQGAHATIPITWDDLTSTLTIGARQGSYPGMPAAMQFNLVLVRNGHGIGEAMTAMPDQTIHY
ncbi:MAG TPA: TIM-barrel domain-containing protein, partial [Terriglobales bacterium]|nr:TIM-barrel domain-containing protein [Terriglobales bacterium]